MSEKIIVSSIKKITLSLLEVSFNQTEVEKKLNEIHAHFQELTKITGFDHKIEYLAAVPSAKGKALGLNHAAQCLLDYKRTVKFLKAIISAIHEKQKNYPNEVIHIFYAGCGPYAPFITLIAPLFTPKNVQFTLLEINKASLESAKKLIQALDLINYIQDYHLADAVTFKVPNANKFHLLFSETLDALLYRECYVPILYNLLPQFNEDITLIPENVLLNLTLLTHSITTPDYKEHDIGHILNVREAVALHTINQPIPTHLQSKTIDLTTLNMNRYNLMLLDTQVHVYNDIWLYRDESSLTLPLEMVLQQPFNNDTITFSYQMEPDIELTCKFD
ncbi:phytanoyl-CoA dioxygenase [Flavivirga aquatica]|uniref:Phytanoyl-CoA dioxygenase n=1 Tax=Flavivirga aquatica TaxID=1849968 RepID=A0A1E5TDW1_9FLAO|nr:phytanoyl-CoA dioxygenase [Flavivirga aquatica]OEK09529.1 phytanoyl-CoA dioxygenase [Flavivirga aquatica]